MTTQQQLEKFLSKYQPTVAAQTKKSLAKLRKLVPNAVEMVYDNYNGLVVGFCPGMRPSEAILSIAVMPRLVTLCFLQGKGLPGPEKRLQGSGRVVRHIKFNLDGAATLDDPYVRKLIQEASPQNSGHGVRFEQKTKREIDKERRPVAVVVAARCLGCITELKKAVLGGVAQEGGLMKYAPWKMGVMICFLSGTLLARPIWMEAWQRASPQPKPSPNAPSEDNALRRLSGQQVTNDNDKQNVDVQNQIELRLAVQRLYALATELKDEVDSVNGNTVLNTAVLRRAQDIEKLAKQIKDRAKR